MSSLARLVAAVALLGASCSANTDVVGKIAQGLFIARKKE